MKDNSKTKAELILELINLREQLLELEKEKSVTREDKLKLSIINQAPFSAWACNRDFKIVFWSAGTTEVYGLNNTDAIGRNYLDLFVSEEERERSASDCLDVIDNGTELRNFLAYDQLPDGTKRALLTNCFRIWDEKEKDYLQAEVALEVRELAPIIEKHRTLRELGIKRKAEYKRILLLEQLGNITTLISSSILGYGGLQEVFEGIITTVKNIVGKSITSGIYLNNEISQQWEPISLIGKKEIFEPIKFEICEFSVREKLTLFIESENDLPSDLPVFVDWWKSKSNHSVAIFPLISMGKMVGVWLIAIQRPYLFEEGTREALRLIANQVAFTVSIARLVQNLRDLNVKVAERQDLITRSLIAVDFVHRMNNLAGPIRGWTGLIKEELDLTHERDQKIFGFLGEVDNEVKELLNAANSLEADPKPQPIDINFMLTAMLRNIKIQYTSINAETTLAQDIYLVSAAYSQLSNAIWNIVSNALDAMPNGGTLSLESRNVENVNTRYVEIKIRNTGQYIAAEHKDRLFEINYTTKGPGRGYGLWRTKHVIEELGGTVALTESGPETATTFTILIPAVQAQG